AWRYHSGSLTRRPSSPPIPGATHTSDWRRRSPHASDCGSLSGPTAIDEQRRAGHKRGRFRGQEDNRTQHVLHRAKPPEFDLAKHFGLERNILEEGLSQRRLQKRRPKRVDTNVVRREFDRHRLRETLHGMLGGTVYAPPRGAHMAHLRGDVDDGARLRGF